MAESEVGNAVDESPLISWKETLHVQPDAVEDKYE